MGRQVENTETLLVEAQMVVNNYVNYLRRLDTLIGKLIEGKELTHDQLIKFRAAIELKNFDAMQILSTQILKKRREDRTVRELRNEAALLCLPNYQSANKATLIAMLEEYDAI